MTQRPLHRCPRRFGVSEGFRDGVATTFGCCLCCGRLQPLAPVGENRNLVCADCMWDGLDGPVYPSGGPFKYDEKRNQRSRIQHNRTEET